MSNTFIEKVLYLSNRFFQKFYLSNGFNQKFYICPTDSSKSSICPTDSSKSSICPTDSSKSSIFPTGTSRRMTLPSLDAARRSQRPYRYGMILLCVGALVNWLGLAENYVEPVRYIGVACIIAGALLICAAMCCWLQRPASDHADNISQVTTTCHVGKNNTYGVYEGSPRHPFAKYISPAFCVLRSLYRTQYFTDCLSLRFVSLTIVLYIVISLLNPFYIFKVHYD